MQYQVQSGDNLSSIGQKFGVPYQSISGYSSGNPNLIRAGETLNIPDSPTQPASPPIPKPTPIAPQGSTPYASIPPQPTKQSQGSSSGYNSSNTNNQYNNPAPTASPNPGNLPDSIWQQVVQGAKDAAKKYGIPASLTISQFIQETGANMDNFIGGTNIFGIKGQGNAGSTNARTLEYDAQGNPYYTDAAFAKYNSIADSIAAHAKLLTENPAYSKIQKLIQTGNHDPGAYAQALQGVYATDPNYARNLQSLMATYGLGHLDEYNNYPGNNEYSAMAQQARQSLDNGQPVPSPNMINNLAQGIGQQFSNLGSAVHSIPQGVQALYDKLPDNPGAIASKESGFGNTLLALNHPQEVLTKFNNWRSQPLTPDRIMFGGEMSNINPGGFAGALMPTYSPEGNLMTVSPMAQNNPSQIPDGKGGFLSSQSDPAALLYEQALNKGNIPLLNQLMNAHPGDARFAVHLGIPGLH